MSDENDTLDHILEKLSDDGRADSENVHNAMETSRTRNTTKFLSPDKMAKQVFK